MHQALGSPIPWYCFYFPWPNLILIFYYHLICIPPLGDRYVFYSSMFLIIAFKIINMFIPSWNLFHYQEFFHKDLANRSKYAQLPPLIFKTNVALLQHLIFCSQTSHLLSSVFEKPLFSIGLSVYKLFRFFGNKYLISSLGDSLSHFSIFYKFYKTNSQCDLTVFIIFVNCYI